MRGYFRDFLGNVGKGVDRIPIRKIISVLFLNWYLRRKNIESEWVWGMRKYMRMIYFSSCVVSGRLFSLEIYSVSRFIHTLKLTGLYTRSMCCSSWRAAMRNVPPWMRDCGAWRKGGKFMFCAEEKVLMRKKIFRWGKRDEEGCIWGRTVRERRVVGWRWTLVVVRSPNSSIHKSCAEV